MSTPDAGCMAVDRTIVLSCNCSVLMAIVEETLRKTKKLYFVIVATIVYVRIVQIRKLFCCRRFLDSGVFIPLHSILCLFDDKHI
jgi:Na+-translocating ferredoxin:NAD+ oxidoreductase RnfE subunit